MHSLLGFVKIFLKYFFLPTRHARGAHGQETTGRVPSLLIKKKCRFLFESQVSGM